LGNNVIIIQLSKMSHRFLYTLIVFTV